MKVNAVSKEQAGFYSTPDQFLQEPDSRPGPYFVTALDAGRMHVMAGPYESHADALADVDRAQVIAYSHDARAWFMAWGTARIEGSTRIGQLNKFNLMPIKEAAA